MSSLLARRIITPKFVCHGSNGSFKLSSSIRNNNMIMTKRSFYSRIPDTEQNRMNALYGLIGTNVVVFLAWMNANSTSNFSLIQFLNRHFTLSSYGVLNQGRIHTLITSTFSHKDFYHLLFNMIGLYTFGINTVMILGLPRFMILYFGGGLISSGCQMIWPKIIPTHWPARRNYNPYSTSLGASGAINAVVAWNILTFPTNRIYLYGILPVPAALFGIGFLASDAYSLYRGDSRFGNADYLGGAAFGVLMFFISKRPSSFRRYH